MGLQDSFDALSRVVEQFESGGRSVRDVEVTADPDHGGALDVSIALPVSLCAASAETLDSSLTPERASLSEGGGLTVTFSASELLPDPATAESVVATDERAVRVDDGELVVTVGFRIEPSGSADAAATATEASRSEPTAGSDDEADDGLAARLAAARSDDVPAYDDTEYLRLLYESCGTFTEMSERIELDVAAETVRRYMIEADIHDPTSYGTGPRERDRDDPEGDEPDRSQPAPDSGTVADGHPVADGVPDEQLVTDGIGLPEGVTLEDIVDAVVDATAVYEVQRSLGLDHDRTRDLLRKLNVLDLVLHRIDGPRQDASKNDVVQRIRQCAATEA